MGRLGVLYREAFDFIKQAKSLNFLNVAGIYTHFPVADVDPAFTRHQIEVFNTLIRRLEKENIHIPLRHAANSMGIIGYKESHFNLVRPGLLAYGLYPKKNMQIKLEPVMSLKTKIVFKKRVPKGQGLSYGHTYRTKSDTTVVTIPIGYGDGYPRNLSNKAAVLIRGKRFRISGRVCMDQILIDVGDLRVKIAEEVILIGSSGRDRITAEELAYKSGTIPYEIVCGVGSRVPRIYK
jgi:alanine racemase